MALSLRENRKKKKHLYKSDTHFNSGNHLFEVEDVNFQMLKWLPNILLTLHKLCIGVVYPPLPKTTTTTFPLYVCVCVCTSVFTSLISCHAVFLFWLQCFSPWNDTMLEMISSLKSRERHTLSYNPNAYLSLESLYSKWAPPHQTWSYL